MTSAGAGGDAGGPAPWRWRVAPLLLAGVAVFVLPWWLPPGGGPVVAESWTVGFGNTWAVVGLQVAILLATALHWHRGGSGLQGWGSGAGTSISGATSGAEPSAGPDPAAEAGSPGGGEPAAEPAGAGPERSSGGTSRPTGAAFAGAAVVGETHQRRRWSVGLLLALGYGLAVVLAHLLIDGADFAESGYFQRRARAVLAGARLWTDVEFVYGPLLLAPQLLLTTWGVPQRLAYDLVFLLSSVAGILLCGRLLAATGAPANVRRTVWILVALASFDLGTGLNYTLLRFLTPLALALAAAGLLAASLERSTVRFAAAMAGVTLASALIGAAFSPEVGIAGAAAAGAAGVAISWRRLSVLFAGLLAGGGGVAAAFFLLPEAYLEGFLAFAGGAHHLPLWPSPHLVLLVAAALTVLPRLGAAAVAVPASGEAELTPERRAQAAALFVWGCALLPGALGRADATHALFYGLVPLVGGLLWLASRRRRAFALGVTAFALVFVVGNQGMTLWLGRGQFLAEAWASLGPRLAADPARQDTIRNVAARLGLPAEKVERALDRGPGRGLPAGLVDAVNQCFTVATPLGVDEHVEADLRFRRRFAASYFLDDHNVVRPVDLQRRLADLGAADCALVPTTASGGGFGPYGDDPAAVERFLRLRLLYPLAYRPIRPAFSPRAEVRRVLDRDWVEVTAVGGWRLLRPRAAR